MSQQTELGITDAQYLKAAMGIIKDPENWTTGLFAHDAAGYMCSPVSPEACKFCVIGAIRKAANNDPTIAMSCLKHLRLSLKDDNVTGWNDAVGRKHSEVIELLKNTISGLENSDNAKSS